jgi:hypothetical protein
VSTNQCAYGKRPSFTADAIIQLKELDYFFDSMCAFEILVVASDSMSLLPSPHVSPNITKGWAWVYKGSLKKPRASIWRPRLKLRLIALAH